jgi:hypothetical protein
MSTPAQQPMTIKPEEWAILKAHLREVCTGVDICDAFVSSPQQFQNPAVMAELLLSMYEHGMRRELPTPWRPMMELLRDPEYATYRKSRDKFAKIEASWKTRKRQPKPPSPPPVEVIIDETPLQPQAKRSRPVGRPTKSKGNVHQFE